MLAKLKAAGLDTRAAARTEGKLSGKTFLFTGELKDYSRHQAGEKVKSLGGAVMGAVSRKVDFVVLGDKPGAKLKKAEELALNIISEDEFRGMVE